MFKINRVTKSINSKSLYKEIDDPLSETFNELYYVSWEKEFVRKTFVASVAEWLDSLVEDNKIDTYESTFNHQSNTFKKSDPLTFSVRYTTQLSQYVANYIHINTIN